MSLGPIRTEVSSSPSSLKVGEFGLMCVIFQCERKTQSSILKVVENVEEPSNKIKFLTKRKAGVN